ncbi:MAG: MarR family transcriptional regulator [Devosia sp.]|nr:MarR family transcriptional regulator [Devosia sp.]
MKDLRLDRQLCFAVYSASHAFTRFYKPLLAQLGVTYPQYLALLTLWEEDSLSVTAIGDRLLLDSGTLTPVLKRLEALGLVSRTRSTTDERQVIVRLTEQGAAMRHVAEGFPTRILDASECSDEELDSLRQALLGLRKNLNHSTA